MKTCIALFNDGWADWEAGPVLAGLRESLGFEVRIATPKGQAATSIGGVRAAGDFAPYHEVPLAETKVLLVIGGSDLWTERERASGSLRPATPRASSVPVGAICAATIAAGRAGLLDRRAHTSNTLAALKQHAPTYAGTPRYQDVRRAVVDGGVVTAPGSAPATFAAEVFRLADREKGPAVAGQFLAEAAAESRRARVAVSPQRAQSPKSDRLCSGRRARNPPKAASPSAIGRICVST